MKVTKVSLVVILLKTGKQEVHLTLTIIRE